VSWRTGGVRARLTRPVQIEDQKRQISALSAALTSVSHSGVKFAKFVAGSVNSLAASRSNVAPFVSSAQTAVDESREAFESVRAAMEAVGVSVVIEEFPSSKKLFGSFRSPQRSRKRREGSPARMEVPDTPPADVVPRAELESLHARHEQELREIETRHERTLGSLALELRTHDAPVSAEFHEVVRERDMYKQATSALESALDQLLSAYDEEESGVAQRRSSAKQPMQTPVVARGPPTSSRSASTADPSQWFATPSNALQRERELRTAAESALRELVSHGRFRPTSVGAREDDGLREEGGATLRVRIEELERETQRLSGEMQLREMGHRDALATREQSMALLNEEILRLSREAESLRADANRSNARETEMAKQLEEMAKQHETAASRVTSLSRDLAKAMDSLRDAESALEAEKQSRSELERSLGRRSREAAAAFRAADEAERALLHGAAQRSPAELQAAMLDEASASPKPSEGSLPLQLARARDRIRGLEAEKQALSAQVSAEKARRSLAEQKSPTALKGDPVVKMMVDEQTRRVREACEAAVDGALRERDEAREQLRVARKAPSPQASDRLRRAEASLSDTLKRATAAEEQLLLAKREAAAATQVAEEEAARADQAESRCADLEEHIGSLQEQLAEAQEMSTSSSGWMSTSMLREAEAAAAAWKARAERASTIIREAEQRAADAETAARAAEEAAVSAGEAAAGRASAEVARAIRASAAAQEENERRLRAWQEEKGRMEQQLRDAEQRVRDAERRAVKALEGSEVSRAEAVAARRLRDEVSQAREWATECQSSAQSEHTRAEEAVARVTRLEKELSAANALERELRREIDGLREAADEMRRLLRVSRQSHEVRLLERSRLGTYLPETPEPSTPDEREPPLSVMRVFPSGGMSVQVGRTPVAPPARSSATPGRIPAQPPPAGFVRDALEGAYRSASDAIQES
jgi:hypothetical protein